MPGPRTPLHVLSGGFLFDRRLRRILTLAGWDIRPGRPGAGGWVGVWGRRGPAARGLAAARDRGAHILTVEDAFLRSLFPGRRGEPALGLLLDRTGVHYDPAAPSDLETLLAGHATVDPALVERAKAAMGWMRRAHLSKFAAVDPALDPPAPGYVLVLDQARGDASVTASGDGDALFDAMFSAARREHPDRAIVVKQHPETPLGFRPGYLDAAAAADRNTTIVRDPISPWRLIDGAAAIYTVSSGFGFEAILAGRRPRVFGGPFYAGWGLSDDEMRFPRRGNPLTAERLFAAAMILYPTWYDPFRDRLCEIEAVIGTLEARARAWREDRAGYVAGGMALWKRAHLSRFFGSHGPMRFRTDPARARTEAHRLKRPLMLWAGREGPVADTPLLRIEDGVLRSRGLGAALTPPMSLVRDDTGIYYDPGQASRLDRLIAASDGLDDVQRARAQRLIDDLTRAELTKYNVGDSDLPDIPQGPRLLVVGQVENDASVLKGCAGIATNAALLETARAARPDAVLLYKPHPDVEAGLRPGRIDAHSARLADVILPRASAAATLGAVDEVWTLTSTLGFEALLRGLPVTCLGMPFYAGWGLTTDHLPAPPWRGQPRDIVALAHAVLIDYPRYADPVTGLPCPPEVVVERLQAGVAPAGGPGIRLMSRLQGLRASMTGR